MSASLVHHLESALQAAQPAALVVAFSGGLDSTALLHALAQLSQARAVGLRALHVHHGLHADATSWAEGCVAACDAWQIPLQTLHCSVARDSGAGIEAAARDARYAALAAAMQSGEWLATAQHQEDQAETLLLRLLRGSGTAALGAMRESRPLGRGTLWRPLLDVPRETLRRYAVAHALSWIDDSSNVDRRFDRSWLRSEVMPLLTARWPHASAAIAQSAALLARDGTLIAQQTAQALDQCLELTDSTLHIPTLRGLPSPLRAHVIRTWLRRAGADALPGHLLEPIETELLAGAVDTQPEVRFGRTIVRRFRDRLYVEPVLPAVDQHWTTQWDGQCRLSLPDGGTLAMHPNWINGPLRVSYRQGGERIRLPGRPHSHRVKTLLQQIGIPPWQRQRLPLIWQGDELLAIADRVVSARFFQIQATVGIKLHWQPAGALYATDGKRHSERASLTSPDAP